MAIMDRLKQAWNAFANNDNREPDFAVNRVGYSSGNRPHRPRQSYTHEKTIISSIYTRIAIDVAGTDIRHIKIDDQGRYVEDANSRLNTALTLEPNIDQGPRAFKQDIVLTMFAEGVAAIVPVDTTIDPETNAVFDIFSLRVGKITNWYPKHVRVDLYNERTGKHEEVILEKRFVAIVENPLYEVMNEPNSTLKRLIRKLSLLDAVDEASSSGKMDIIIQLPYVIKSDARANAAEVRRAALEEQLTNSRYGIGYVDGTEKIIQLNRPAENNLLTQVEYLTKMLYAQLGITEEVMNGTADEKTMLNYYNRTKEPILDVIVEAMNRTFLGPPTVLKKDRIRFFKDPFKLVPVADLAEIADKFTRNEILTTNEIRSYMGIPPSKDPKADKLVNSNMPQPSDHAPTSESGSAVVQSAFDEVDAAIDGVFKDLDIPDPGGADGRI